ncbi:hypothetical protein ACFPQ4_22770 [Cohnella yongneupensis]|uniref:Uncharacterized protein n=2 Tax=Cohnella yongneupensis TaxID=425006 RepID=A0ABW0R5L6_9BACL
MNRIHFSKALCMNISTYDNLNGHGEQIVFLLKTVFNLFLKHTSEKLSIQCERMNHRVQSSIFEEKKLTKIYELILQGEVLELIIEDREGSDINNERSYPPEFSLVLMCNHAATYSLPDDKKFNFANGLSISLNESLFTDNLIPSSVQENFINLFITILKSINGAMGYITFETAAAYIVGGTLFENYHRINTNLAPGYTKYVSGYHWMNFLNSNQISQLGGHEWICNNAPCKVIPIDPHGLILQLSDNVNNYSDNQLLELREFLSPLFHPGVGKSGPLIFEDGYYHRLVEIQVL